jgi:hypothetical protein
MASLLLLNVSEPTVQYREGMQRILFSFAKFFRMVGSHFFRYLLNRNQVPLGFVGLECMSCLVIAWRNTLFQLTT